MRKVLFDTDSESFLKTSLGLNELKNDEKNKMAYYKEDEAVIEEDNWVDLLLLIDRDDFIN